MPSYDMLLGQTASHTASIVAITGMPTHIQEAQQRDVCLDCIPVPAENWDLDSLRCMSLRGRAGIPSGRDRSAKTPD